MDGRRRRHHHQLHADDPGLFVSFPPEFSDDGAVEERNGNANQGHGQECRKGVRGLRSACPPDHPGRLRHRGQDHRGRVPRGLVEAEGVLPHAAGEGPQDSEAEYRRDASGEDGKQEKIGNFAPFIPFFSPHPFLPPPAPLVFPFFSFFFSFLSFIRLQKTTPYSRYGGGRFANSIRFAPPH